MEIKLLMKYDRSRLNGCLIRDLSVYSDGKVRVNAENGETKEFHVYPEDLGKSDDIFDYSADYIICYLQGDRDILVSKY